jgi:membrane protease YdiL (CAAX protease family)
MLSLIIASLRSAMPVLVIIALSGDPWRLFGIVRPRLIADALGGFAIWFIAIMAYYFVMSLLPRSILAGFAAAPRARPDGIAGILLLLVAEGANGFAEELVMRAYLITRLQRLLASTWAAVIVTTALFASYHIYLGAAGVISAATLGLVYAIMFCWFRRLWPLCVAHAVHDILIRL